MSDRIAFAGSVTAEGRRIKGSVQLAGSRTFRNGEWVQVDPAALIRADASKAFASMEHNDALLLGIATNETLTLHRTEQGFDYETAELPNTSYANDALELVRGKYISGSSFEIDGLTSRFSTDPDGTRVRTYTGIKRLVSVSPVRDPAFPSMAAAFSKEPEVTDQIVPEPIAAPPPPAVIAPAALTEAPKPADEWAAFAKDLAPEQLEGAMEAIFSRAQGDPKGNELDQYKAFSDELRARRRVTTESTQRIANMKFAHDLAMGRVPKAPEAELFASDDYKAAFGRYLRTGDKALMEQFTGQSIAGDGTQGGFAVPESFLVRITERMKAFGGVQKYAENITTSDGRALPWPTNDDTANSAAIATEGSAVGSGGADLVFGEVSLGAYSYDATGASNLPLAVSKELIQDAAFDVEAFVARKLGQRLGRKMAADFATANGSSKPKGLFDKTADVMSATTAYAAFVEHLLQVDQAYRDSGNCRWLFSDTILSIVMNSQDTTNRPMFQPLAASGGQDGPAGFILGYPVALDQGAGSKVAFGDINAGYIVRNVRGVTVDVDPYTLISKRQVAFHAWARADGQIQDSFAVSVSDYSGVSADT